MKELGRIIKLHTISDPRGNLTVSEENIELPFDLKRAYWIYDVPQGGNRGGHAHKKLQQVIIAVHGSFTVSLDNGKETKKYQLSNPGMGSISAQRYGAHWMISPREPYAWCLPLNFMSQKTICMNTMNF